MARPFEPPSPVFVGRARELELIRDLLDRSAAEEAQTLIVSGDAGVGKTALIARACGLDARPTTTLIGACLPLASMSIPLLPIRSALRDIGEPIDSAADGHPDVDGRDATIRFDGWLDRRCAAQPVVLVVDDVQWADRSTLDALMYLVAGPARRRLSVIVTLRSGEVGLGHPLHRWLADIRRLPRTSELGLEPLDRAGTAAQIEGLMGVPPHQTLIDDVHRHGRGNPYFTRLLVSGLPPDARNAPTEFPATLSSAVLQSWSLLSAPTRRLATILAVGGRPMRADELAEVMGDEALAPVHGRLDEAVAGGAIEVVEGGAYWFHHPLNAEVLEAQLPEDERRELHRRFADVIEARMNDGAPAATIVAVADHRAESGDASSALDWAMRAADALEATDGWAEQLRLVRRARALLPDGPGAEARRGALLRRQRSIAAAAGATLDELEAVEALLARADSDGEPLVAAELMVRRMHLRFMAGRGFIEVGAMREAVRRAFADRSSAEYALALAELAHAELWAELPDAAAHARAAIVVARGANDPRALSHALAAASMAATFAEDLPLASSYGREAVAAALAAHDWMAFVHALLWEANAVETWASEWFAERMAERRLELVARGGPQAYVAWLSASEASSLLVIGRGAECEERLRVALGSNAGPLGDVAARLTAARFASLQGRRAEAQGHLLRADELFADGSAFLAFEFDAVRAEVRLGGGDQRGAFEAAMAGATGEGTRPTMCEWLIPLAARALADLARAARDDGGDAGEVLAELDALAERFPGALRDIGMVTPLVARQMTAFDALYAAEQARARITEDEPAAWTAAVDACAAAGLPWEEAYARWRAADALLGRGRDRLRGSEMLRDGLGLARRLGARPVEDELLGLAERARIPVGEPADVASDAPAALPGLTDREREVLELIAVGRTYGEIARTLMISEKTVSTHVSHLLAKTGTANRVELAGLAHRVARERPDDR
ncbi:ATP-binding protein [Agromyces sp. NPDC058126]|uniref:ATP-binding protein n=1 Tax=Agromyces sp. NPDC058126 TaxID=3346350 RepID=UPI0036DBC80A